MAIVHSYIRFSTKKQMEGDSLRRQVESGDKWIEKNGHVKSSLNLQDLGISAYKGKNRDTGKLGYFIDAIKTGRVKPGDILLLENLDRLSRQGIIEAQALFGQILKAGVLIAVLNPYEIVYTEKSLEDLVGILIPLIYFHLAYVESKNKSGRLSEVWTTRRKASHDGKVIDGSRPAWVDYDKPSRTFKLNPGAEAIRHVFRRTADGVGQVTLVGELQRGFKPIGKTGRWGGSYVQKVLDDRRVLGERQNYTFDQEGVRVPIGQPIKGYFPPVIDDALWYQAQARKSQKAKMKGPNAGFINVFVGLLRNSHDGYAMHSITARVPSGRVQRRLVSRGHIDKVAGSDPVSILYVHLEYLVLHYMTELKIEDLESRFDPEGLRSKEQERSGIETRIAELQAELSNPKSQGIAYILPALTALSKTLETLDTEISRIKEGLHAGTPLEETQSIIRQLIDTEKDGDKAAIRSFRMRLRTLIAELVETITIKPEKHRGKVYFLAQINFRNGMFRQVNGPVGSPVGWGGHVRPVTATEGELTLDLRNQEAARATSVFAERVAALVSQDVPQPPGGAIPATLGAAADRWLAEIRGRMTSDSHRIIAPKVKRLVDVLGADLPTRDLTDARWDLWIRTLKVQIKEGTAKNTARVIYSRSREFARWLIDQGGCPPLVGLEKSAATVIA